MTERWTWLDTGVRTAHDNVALDDVLLTSRDKGYIPNTLRFLQFSPNAVLVGFHQSVEQEVRTEYCRERGIDIGRRITGGGAIYLDEPQLGWELVASKDHPLIPGRVDEIYERMCECTVKGLEKLGVKAAFRPKNDIEVDGKKISGTGGTLQGDAFLFQGTLLTDFDVDTMLRSLMIPIEKLQDKELESVRERVTCLKWELGYLPDPEAIKKALRAGFAEVLGVEFTERELTLEERSLLDTKRDHYRSEEWVFGIRRPVEHRKVLRAVHKAPGGLIRVSAVADIPNRRIQAMLITGDFFAFPKRSVFDLESIFKDAPLEKDKLERMILDFFSERDVRIPGVTPRDFVTAVSKMTGKVELLKLGVPLEEVNKIFTVLGPVSNMTDFPVLLLPYCSKLVGCDYRYRKECGPCSMCTVGPAYELAYEKNMRPVTILNFEDLMRTLRKLKEDGVPAFIGSCCEAFYVKHLRDFEEAELPGIIVDIDTQTCYDLGREREAKKGVYEGQTHLNMDLLRKVVDIFRSEGGAGSGEVGEPPDIPLSVLGG